MSPRYLLLSLSCLLSGCAAATEFVRQEHLQIYCLASASYVPFIGAVAQAQCAGAWGAPWQFGGNNG